MDEERLIERMKHGDEEAFTRVYEKYRELVYRTACLIMGDAVNGEDVAQDTWVQVYLHIRQLHDSSRFKPWVMQILHRVALKVIQRRKREVPDELILEKADSGRSNPDSPEYSFLDKERETEILKEIASLKYKQKVVVVLYYYDELSVKEIAAVTGSTEGTVKTRLFAARRKLSKTLEDMV